jgi:hypothetical protein
MEEGNARTRASPFSPGILTGRPEALTLGKPCGLSLPHPSWYVQATLCLAGAVLVQDTDGQDADNGEQGNRKMDTVWW